MTDTFAPRRRPVLLRAHRWLAAVVFLLGILGAKALGDHFTALEGARQERAFAEISERVGTDLDGLLTQKITALGGVADAAAVSELNRPEEIATVAARVQARMPSLDAVAIARAVDDVVTYEAQPEAVAVGPTREGPAVVLEVVIPSEGTEAAVGFDLLSERNRAEAIAAARDRAEPVASAPIQPVPIEVGAGLASVVFLPVYEGGAAPIAIDARQRSFLGGITALLRPTLLLADVVPAQVRAEIWDVGPVDGARSIPVHMASSDRRVVAGQDVDGPRTIVEQEVLGRRWQIVVDGVALGGDASLWLTRGLPVTGSLVALLLAALVLVGGGSLERAHRDRELLALREVERQAIVTAFGDGYLRLDGDLVVQSASGGPWPDPVGRHVAVVDEVAGPSLAVVAGRAIDAQRTEAIDLELPASTEAGRATVTTIEVRATPLADGLGLSLRDVTMRAEMERQLRIANDGIKSLASALELRVEERTRELAALTTHLGKTNDELERFVYTAAHELRTPLTMMVGALSWFDEFLDVDSLEKDLIDRSRRAADRMREQIDRLVEDAHAVAIGEREAIVASTPGRSTASEDSMQGASGSG